MATKPEDQNREAELSRQQLEAALRECQAQLRELEAMLRASRQDNTPPK